MTTFLIMSQKQENNSAVTELDLKSNYRVLEGNFENEFRQIILWVFSQ